jgi:release factor glutamine methyltransferase
MSEGHRLLHIAVPAKPVWKFGWKGGQTMTDTEKAQSLGECRNAAGEYLSEHGIEDAGTDAWILFSEITGLKRSEYFIRQQEEMDPALRKRFFELVRKRAEHIPVQYLLGKAWCYGNTFTVNEHVLIPRQDTEILIEEAAKRIRTGMHILDLCTGSGCILVSLLKQKSITGVGSDISEEALRVARENLNHYHLEAELVRSDLMRDIRGSFDVIVSNPPYIPSDVIGRLDPEVKDHEPKIALDGGPDGLKFYRAIVRQARRHLNVNGWLLMEIGYDEGDDVREMLEDLGYVEVEIIKDYSGLDRVAAGRFQGIAEHNG